MLDASIIYSKTQQGFFVQESVIGSETSYWRLKVYMIIQEALCSFCLRMHKTL